MGLELTVPALPFMAISLLISAYTIGFLVLAQLLRWLDSIYKLSPEGGIFYNAHIRSLDIHNCDCLSI